MGRERIEPDGVYEITKGVDAQSSRSFVTFVVLGECTAKTVRFKREEPGWRILVLASHLWSDVQPGSLFEWVKEANFFTKAKRLA